MTHDFYDHNWRPASPSATSLEDILAFAHRLDFDPDPIQARLLTTQCARVILNCTRQWGKSTVTALRAVHLAYTRPDSLIVITAPSERQSGEFVRKAECFVQRLGIRPRGDGVNRISILLPNRSRIVAVPNRDATSRGFSAVNLLVVDEAAQARDDLFTALRPMLATSNGHIWLLSTPHGKRGFFYKIWTSGGPAWDRVRVTASECPRIPPEFLEQEKQSTSHEEFLQEYGCEFITPDGFLFDPDLIEKSVSPDEKAWKL